MEDNPRIPRYKISLVREGSIDVGDYRTLSHAEAAANVFRKLFEGSDREIFAIATLDSKNKIIGVNICTMGTLNMSLVSMREAMKLAVLQNAAAIIHAHNHPSGVSDPSAEDHNSHKKLVAAGEIMGVRVLDGLILGEKDFFTMSTGMKTKWPDNAPFTAEWE